MTQGKQSKKDDSINIVYIADDNYIVPMCTSLISVLSNKKEDDNIVFHVLLDSVEKQNLDNVLSMQEIYPHIRVYPVNSLEYNSLMSNGINSHVSSGALLKFSIQNVLGDIERVIYLDCDTIIQGSLSVIFRYDLKNKYIAAVPDMLIQMIKKENPKSYSYIDVDEYINSGVMLLDLNKLRHIDATEKLVRYKKEGINRFADQDAFNFVFNGNVVYLDFCFNFLTSVFEYYGFEEIYSMFHFDQGKQYGKQIEEYIGSMTVLHMAGEIKPWQCNIPIFTDIYMRYCGLLPFDLGDINILNPLYYINKIRNKKSSDFERLEQILIPYKTIEKSSRVIIYGAGKVGKACIKQMEAIGYCSIVGWTDSNSQIKSNTMSVEDIPSTEFDYIIIAIKDESIVNDVRNMLICKYGIDNSKIAWALQKM